MSKPPNQADTMDSVSASDRSADILARFETAWKQALRGAAEPVIDEYLAEQSESERAALRSQLERLAQNYRRQRDDLPGSGNAATVGYSPAALANTPEPAPGATVEFDTKPPTGPAATIGVEDAEGDLGFEVGRALDDKTRLEPTEQEDETRVDRPVVAGYEILGELGRGGMGVVYKARQVKLNRVVALKMVLAGVHAGTEQLARFYVEAQAVAHLQHPNIVQIYEVSEQAGLPYFSLEFVDSGSLAQKAAAKPQPVREAAHIIECLARAMHYAHQNGVVHRDLKPANVLLTAQGIPKITDFGLAKRLEGESSSQTRSGAILGTPSYMAPEQAKGEVHQVGPLTDVYAIGAILYELLTGRPPFAGPTAMDTVVQVTRDEPVAPCELQPSIPRDVETICLKCLQKEQPKRYASAGALADDLQRFLAGEPILARPVSAPERLVRWCRRNPRVAFLTGLVVLLVAAGLVGLGVANVRISHEKEQAEVERKAAVKARDLARQKEQDAQEAATAEKEARELADQKTDEARDAQKLADQNAQVAGEQRKLALDTLYSVVKDVEEKLRDRSDMNTLRQDVLETALKGLEKLSRTDENLAFADRTVGAAHQRMGDIFQRAGRSEAAQEQYKKGLAIFEKLLQDDPKNDLAAYNAALCYDGLGDVSRKLGEDAEVARLCYAKALTIREALAVERRSPELKAYIINAALVNSYARLGMLTLELLGDPASAKAYFEQALRQSEAFAAAFNHPTAKQGLAGSWFLLGKVSLRLGDVDSARRYYDQALKLRQELLDADALSIKAKQDMAVSYWALGDMDLQSGNAREALEHYRMAHNFRDALYQKDRDSSEMQWDLSGSFYRLGNAYRALGQFGDAEMGYRECLDLREPLVEKDPSNAAKQIDLMLARARCGQHEEASRIAAALLDRVYPNPGTLFSIACGYALCISAVEHGKSSENLTPDERALQEHYAEAAMENLRQGIARGFKDVTALKSDSDLEPLRATDRFQRIGIKSDTR